MSANTLAIIGVATTILLAVFGGMAGLIVYFYKSNENAAALLITTELKNIGRKLDVLFQKDENKVLRITELEKTMAEQIQRCNDRERACPGKEIKRSLELSRKS